MILVIADDFTGAAEIAGIGLNHGLKVVVQTDLKISSDADMVVISANTRSLTRHAAVEKMKQLSETLKWVDFNFIYKKIDSVLRGHIVAELQAQMEVMNLKNAIIVPGNPLLGRTTVNGKLFVNGRQLSETEFAIDPHFPAKSSNVFRLLDPSEENKLIYLQPKKEIPGGVVVGEVSCAKDLEYWASLQSADRLYVGAANYFEALLSYQGIKPSRVKPFFPFGRRVLCVEGSSYLKSKGFDQVLLKNGVVFSDIPDDIYWNKDFGYNLLNSWSEDVKEALKHGNVCVTIRKKGSAEIGLSKRLSEVLGELLRQVTAGSIIDELVIEGGDTAAALLKTLMIERLQPVQVLGHGVVRMEVLGDRNFYVTTKPGSYQWPDIFNLSN